MPKEKIVTRVGRGDNASAPVTVEYDIPADLPGMEKAWGTKVCKAHLSSSIVIALQGFIRTRMKKYLDKNEPVNVAEIQKAVAEWKPGIRTPGRSKLERLQDETKSMSAEDKKALLEKLKADLAKAA